ncbi:MAG: acyltransferase [Phycisphaeraceae bacterium]|nr:acyltransferase [Phycisphaeraceae bacterium]
MGGLAKKIIRLLGFLRAVPHLLRYGLESKVIGQERAFLDASERIGLIAGLWGVYTRQAFYKRTLAHVGVDVHFAFMTTFSKAQARLGDRVCFGRGVSVGWADIGDDALIGDGTHVLSGRHQHGTQPQQGQTLRDNQLNFSKVTIGSGVWVGAGGIIMADVGDHALVGAGAVVTRPVAPHTRVAGSPARPIVPTANSSTGSKLSPAA